MGKEEVILNEVQIREFAYRTFQRMNDETKKRTPSKLVGHIDKVDFETNLLWLNVNGSITVVPIMDFVAGVRVSAGCVSNPSALEGWKGFGESERKIIVSEQNGLNWIIIENVKYCVGYVQGMKETSNWERVVLNGLNGYLQRNKVGKLSFQEENVIKKQLNK